MQNVSEAIKDIAFKIPLALTILQWLKQMVNKVFVTFVECSSSCACCATEKPRENVAFACVRSPLRAWARPRNMNAKSSFGF